MASRKRVHQKTPDILGAVLDKSLASEPENPDTPERPENSMPVRQQNAKTVSQPEADKVKATFYLSQEAVDALEEAWYQLRKLVKSDRGRVSKSAIMDISVRMALGELEAKGAESQLARKMLSQ